MCVWAVHFFGLWISVLLYGCAGLFTQSSVDWHLCFSTFQLLKIMNIWIQIFVWTHAFIFPGYKLRTGTAGSYLNLGFNLLRNYQTGDKYKIVFWLCHKLYLFNILATDEFIPYHTSVTLCGQDTISKWGTEEKGEIETYTERTNVWITRGKEGMEWIGRLGLTYIHH